MQSSIFMKGKTRPTIPNIKEPDFTLPKLLWDVNKGFRRTPSSLANIYNNKVKLNQIEQKIISDRELLRERINKLEIEYARKIDEYSSGIKYTKEVKDQEFRIKRDKIKREREESLAETLQSLKDYENEKRYAFEKEYKQTLEINKKVISMAEDILKTYGYTLSPRELKPKINYKEHTSQEILEILEYIKGEMANLKGDTIVVKNLWKRVSELDTKETAITGAVAMASAILFTPALVGGTASAFAVAMKKNKATKEVMDGLMVEVSSIWRIAKRRYEDRKKDNVINLGEIQEEFQLRYKAIEDQHRLSIQNLEEEERLWVEEHKQSQNSNRELALKKELREKKEELLQRHQNQNQSVLQMKQDQEKTFNQSKVDFERENKLPNLKDTFDSDIHKEIKVVRTMLQNYIKYRNLIKLSYNLDYTGDVPDKISKSEYDNLIYHKDLLPLKREIEENEKEGRTEEYFKKELDRLSRMEDSLYILDTNKLHLGELIQESKYENLGHIEQVLSEDFNNGSMLLVYDNAEEEKYLINYTKYLLQQIMSKMHPQALQINIINPTMDTIFNDLVIDTQPPKLTDPALPYVDTYIGEDIELIRETLQRQIKERQYGDLKGGGTITEVVKAKRKMDSKTPKYYINVLHRVGVEDDLMLINENSDVYGIVNICLIDKKKLINPKKHDREIEMDREVKDLLARNKTLITVNDITPNGELILSVFNRDTTSYKQIKYLPMTKSSIDDRRKFFTERYFRALNNVTATLIDEYLLQVVGDRLWSLSAETTLELHFGYVDGDKSRPEPIILNEDDKVHVFLGGTTGGGKSVTLAMLINMLKMLYPPSELEAFYYDFKQVEVALHSKPYKWSNASALAGSATAEYFVSLLEELTSQMDLRYSNMKKLNRNKLSSYRQYLREIKQDLIDKGEFERAKKVEIPPRMVVIMDEVQEGFTIDDETTEILRASLKKLSKVARAAGMHLILVTQNPEGVIPSDVITLFTVRGCTKASPSVSKAIIGNDFCARQENQYLGFFAVNTSPQGLEEANVRYLVPYTSEAHSQLYSKMSSDLAEMSETEVSKDAVVYDDGDIVTYEMLDEMIDKTEIQPYQLVLGDIVKYLREYEPAKIELLPDQAQNIAFVSANRTNKVDFFRTVMKSINKAGNKALVFFGKGHEEVYEVDNVIQNRLMMKTIYKEASTGNVTNAVSIEDLESGRYEEVRIPRYYYDFEDYGDKPKFGSKEDDETLIGLLTTTYQGLIELQLQEKEKTGKYDPKYVFLIDPEKDKYILPNKEFATDSFKMLMNEACSVGIYTITITSNLTQLAERDWNRYIIGKELGSSAQYDKNFKKLKDGLAMVVNKVNPNEGFTFKLPMKEGSNKMPWEI